jgi:hypothetical protein
MPRIVIGVMGPGEGATEADCRLAEELGERIAEKGWVTLTGGRPVGVMEAALRGARRRNGLTIGVLPGGSAADASTEADIRIATGLGEARNVINVLSSDVVCVCGMSPGTASEVAFALKTGRPTILVAPEATSEHFWRAFDSEWLHVVRTVEEAIELMGRITATRAGAGEDSRRG